MHLREITYKTGKILLPYASCYHVGVLWNSLADTTISGHETDIVWSNKSKAYSTFLVYKSPIHYNLLQLVLGTKGSRTCMGWRKTIFISEI